ncbi:type II toxin-antitoxin system RnlA family toxin (plasmid) [Carnobacterium viridans]|uniref:RNase LS, toxin n=1 Tax=Carnobacterium viridans TaxID=174587 RepID=A0A1H1CJJ1_9LACT|nr:type II toxin-antitoxin system RnlA family toxin [Carnobacterium viridans]UDE96371.1 type II toxin-antitoxin system RnlA family toxin [Carnobacterium viridans]SDQ64278.1 RNase LS, toxin [Carnobacterium viridans]
MAKKPLYGKLNIVQDQIEVAIVAFFSEKTGEYSIENLNPITESRNRIEFTYLDELYKVDFHFNNDGTTTIDLSPGGPDPIKTELANYIKTSSICTIDKISNFDNPWFVFEDFNYDDFIAVISLIKEQDNVKESEYKKTDIAEIWSLKSTPGEKVNVSFFKKNKKAVIQGKPLTLFSDIYTSLISLMDIENVPAIMNQQTYVAEKVTKKSIEAELENYLPNCSDKISSKVRILCYQSIFNLKIHDEMFDYGFLSFPSLKLLEGHLKYIMKDKSIQLKDGNFSMFIKDPLERQKYILHPEYDSYFTAKQKNAVNNAYTFYNIHRHSIFHWGNIDSPIKGRDTTIVHDRPDTAHGIINNALDIVNSYYM